MYCKICGAPLAPGEVFCKNCGASNTSSNVEPIVPNVEPNVEPIVSNDVGHSSNPVNNGPIAAVEPNKEEAEDKKVNDKFLIVIGVVVGILSALVIAYLIYSSLQAKDKNNKGADVKIVTQNNYNVNYANHSFNFSSDTVVIVGEYLEIKKSKWEAKLSYVENSEFSKINAENIKKTFESVTDYSLGEVVQKNYSGLACFEGNVDYTNGTKTMLLLCDRKVGGYWLLEVGTTPYSDYPQNVSEELTTIIRSARVLSDDESKLNIGRVEIVVDETVNEENDTRIAE